jgi:hypothetical protein
VVPVFEQPIKHVDRWSGQESICLHGGVINELSYTFSVVGGRSVKYQKDIAVRILNNYDDHWNIIEASIKKRFSLDSLNNRLLVFVPARVGSEEYEFMLGYEFEENGVLYSAFFAFNNNQLEWSHVDGY